MKTNKNSFIDWVVGFWWLFPLVTILLAMVPLFIIDGHPVLGIVMCCIAAVLLLLQLPVFVILLINKKWWRAVGAFILGVLSLLPFGGIAFSFIAMFAASLFSMEPDDFGKKHPIPDGLEYNIPITDSVQGWNAQDGFMFTPVEIDSTDTNSWLQIWNGGQGGIYNFAFYWPALEDGDVYLRCFEVTENIELSKDRLKARTTTQVSNHKSFGQVVDPNHKDFTIYEGDWEDYYAVRVEVWHKPIHGKTHKLMEKIYRMEGWMR